MSIPSNRYFANEQALKSLLGNRAFGDLEKLLDPCCGIGIDNICTDPCDSIIGARNGLHLDAGFVELGGPLLEDTEITFDLGTNYILLGDPVLGNNSLFAVGNAFADGNNGLYFAGDIVDTTVYFSDGNDASLIITTLDGITGNGAALQHTNIAGNLRAAVFAWRDSSGIERSEIFVQDTLLNIDISKWEANINMVEGRYYLNVGVDSSFSGYVAGATLAMMAFGGDTSDPTTGTAIVTTNGASAAYSGGSKYLLLDTTNSLYVIGDVDGVDNLTRIRIDDSIFAIQCNNRFEEDMGISLVAANDLTLGNDGNNFVVTGNTQVNAITILNWQNGSHVTLQFTGTPTIKHNTAGGAGTAPLFLAGSVDLSAANNTVLGLWYDGTQWQETFRKVA